MMYELDIESVSAESTDRKTGALFERSLRLVEGTQTLESGFDEWLSEGAASAVISSLIREKNLRRAVVYDPITGKPLHESVLRDVGVGPEIMPQETDDDITGPDDSYAPPAKRDPGGVQYIAHIEDPYDLGQVDELVAMLRGKWRERRVELGLDEPDKVTRSVRGAEVSRVLAMSEEDRSRLNVLLSEGKTFDEAMEILRPTPPWWPDPPT
jgi:hypothetical protein